MKQFFLIVLCVSSTFVLQAQNFTMEISPIFPMGDYAKDDINDEDQWGAGIGIGLGLSYSYPISDMGLAVFGETGVYFQSLKKGYRDDLEDLHNADGTIKHLKYISFPLLGGLQYASDGDGVGFFTKIGAGVGFFKPTKFVAEFDQGDYIITSDLSTGFAFTIAAGVVLNEKITLGLKYLTLGKREFDAESRLDYKDENIPDVKEKIEDNKVSPANLLFTIGMRF